VFAERTVAVRLTEGIGVPLLYTKEAAAGVTDTDDGRTSLTVTAQAAVWLLSADFAVITALPGAIAVTFPLALTAATPEFDELHRTVLFVAFGGATVAISVCVSPPVEPTSSVSVDLFSEIPVVGI
jgi:hypothetical protein